MRKHLESDFERLEFGKNPGLGVRSLHQAGITGQSVNVGIIDQRLLKDHQEYKQALVDYQEIDMDGLNYGPEMHGSAVASLLVGKNCGVAPGARLFYKATPSIRGPGFFNAYAKALIEFLEVKDSLRPKVVSCSVGFNGDDRKFGLDVWQEALFESEKQGLIVVHANLDFYFIGGGQPHDKESIEDFEEASWLRRQGLLNQESIHIPSDYRTRASEAGINDYCFDEQGGLSWSIPYLAGVITLMLQVNPGLTKAQSLEIIQKTCSVNSKSLKIINPVAAVEMAKTLI